MSITPVRRGSSRALAIRICSLLFVAGPLIFPSLALADGDDACAKRACVDLESCIKYWDCRAMMCEAEPGGFSYPSKAPDDDSRPCGDGDMTLFNGLLCAAGDKRGCDGVAEAQNPQTGEWSRSPRYERLGRYDGAASFSPDMALGVQLYLVKTRDVDRAMKWLNWLEEIVPCYITIKGVCFWRGIPAFCRQQSCVMRPGDAASLASTVRYLQANAGMAALPNGNLKRYLHDFGGSPSLSSAIGALVNKPGYSQHLVGVNVLLLQLMGGSNFLSEDAAYLLAKKNPGNAFYSYLNKAGREQVTKQILARCPPSHPLTPPLSQWQWERANSDEAWKKSCYWDCVFMAEMINGPLEQYAWRGLDKKTDDLAIKPR